jgi:hypothetical protein
LGTCSKGRSWYVNSIGHGCVSVQVQVEHAPSWTNSNVDPVDKEPVEAEKLTLVHGVWRSRYDDFHANGSSA